MLAEGAGVARVDGDVGDLGGDAVDGGARAPVVPHVAPVQRGKRCFDFLVAAALLLVLSPLLVLVMLVVLVAEGLPVFFRQERVGYHDEIFSMWKFRTMEIGAHERQGHLGRHNAGNGLLFKVHHDPRVTRVGHVLRRTSIDELPQLWNVVRGEMSLVGPRPLPVDPGDFGPDDAVRHVVRPGITGLWQIEGRDRQDYDDMVALDVEYIATWSLRRDIGILLRTVPALLRRDGPA